MVRGRYSGSRLNFDSQGNLVGSARLLEFGLSAVRLGEIRVTDSLLDVECIREGLEFARGTTADSSESVSAVQLDQDNPQRVEIRIARDPQHPVALNAALDKIFSVGFDDSLAESAPVYWQQWLRHDLHPGMPAAVIPDGVLDWGDGRSTRVDGLAPPRLVHTVNPHFPNDPRMRRFRGNVVLSVIVDKAGVPRDVSILHPLGMGLDEVAVTLVSQYKFTPAKKDGQPVPVSINVAVMFRP
jgi:TonB family protein